MTITVMMTLIVALLSAVAGVVGTLLTNRGVRQQARLQLQAERDRSRLEARSLAYQDFASAAHALHTHLSDLQFEPLTGGDNYQGEYAARSVELGGSLRESQRRVVLAGPPSMDRASDRVLEAFRPSLGVFRFLVAASSVNATEARTSPSLSDLRQDLPRIDTAIAEFLRCAQVVLADDGAGLAIRRSPRRV